MLESRPSAPAERSNSAASVGASTAFTMRYTYDTKYPARNGAETRKKTRFSSRASRTRPGRSGSRSG
jgi:hypothetical protein